MKNGRPLGRGNEIKQVMTKKARISKQKTILEERVVKIEGYLWKKSVNKECANS